MIDETDMSVEMSWFYEERAKVVVANLQKRHINAQYASTRAEALDAVLEMIPEGDTVVRGDSVSVDEVGVIPALKKRDKNKIIDAFERDADGHFLPEVKQNRGKMQREAFSTDVFLTGTNAVTLDGKLVSTDALGNRVAPTIFGPKKVILVIGANKIVKGLDEALERIRDFCAPVNAKRHALKHHAPQFEGLPCARTGKCADCRSEWRICCSTVIIEAVYGGQEGRINVVLVGEALGI